MNYATGIALKPVTITTPVQPIHNKELPQTATSNARTPPSRHVLPTMVAAQLAVTLSPIQTALPSAETASLKQEKLATEIARVHVMMGWLALPIP